MAFVDVCPDVKLEQSWSECLCVVACGGAAACVDEEEEDLSGLGFLEAASWRVWMWLLVEEREPLCMLENLSNTMTSIIPSPALTFRKMR